MLEFQRITAYDTPSLLLIMWCVSRYVGDWNFVKKLESFETKDHTVCRYISDERNYKLLNVAHIILVLAVREGWGQVVTKANAMGTSPIG